MPTTIDDARRLAERLANAATLRSGRPWRGFVEEFGSGWAVWTAPPAGERPDIGGGAKTVLDKETGGLSRWPPWAIDVLAAEYEAARPVSGPPPPDYPSLLPLLERTAWIEAPDGRVWWHESSVGDMPPELDPALAEWLRAQPSPVFGARRHAELLVLSRALGDGADLARSSIRRQLDAPCDTCLQAYIHFGLLDERAIPPIGRTALITDVPTFPDGRAFEPKRWAQIAFELLSPVIPPVEAARGVIERYPLVVSDTRGPGRECWVRPFRLGITRAMTDHMPALIGFADLMRAVLYPIGTVDGDDGLIVVNGHGQIFVLDQAGAWFCGPDIDTALTTLSEGHAPLRVQADGSFSTRGDHGEHGPV
ncbi:SUKH-3 domain-containing protein [Allorhizocola rhizosphaerae]|uniref:SUKH-3 domain-containing protein n=1 Tax=Allorhizocola rhizosphaerae TaxID=1872709 RepID=UPI0013C2A4A2|nr:SUKH-3 domain-containing protein [Allorhizocola rhizosphaerae]